MSEPNLTDVETDILIVEDDEDVAGLVGMKLGIEGHQARIAHSIAAALEEIAERRPDLILLDLILGEENGRDLITDLDRRGELSPFVVVTAHGDESVAVEMMRLGARDYIVKDESFVDGIPRVVRRALTEVATEKRLEEAEAALRRNERVFHRMFESLEDVFWVTDGQTGTTVYASPAYERVWGLDLEALYEDPARWSAFIHPDDRRRVRSAFARVRDTGIYDEEYRLVRPDGRVRLIRDRGIAVPDGAGRSQQAVGVARDITDVRRAQEIERALQRIHQAAVEEADLRGLLVKIREHLSVLFDTSSFHVALHEPQTGTYRFPYSADRCDTADGGRSRQPPKRLVDYVRRTGRATLVDEAVLDEFISQGEVGRAETPSSAQWMGAPLKSEGVVFGVVAVKNSDAQGLYSRNDVALLERAAAPIAIAVAHRIAGDTVRESEERLRNIVEHSTNLFFSHTPDHVLTYLSPQCREILGCEPEEAYERWTEFTTDNPVNALGYEATRRAITTGERQPPYELELQSRSGRRVCVEVHEAPVVENGEVVSIVGALTDITERRNAESALAASEERYRQLFERNVAGVYRSTIDGRLLSCNMAVAKMFGYASPEEAQGTSTVFYYRKREDRQRFLDALLKNGSVVGWEASLKRRDDQPLTAVLSASVIEDEDGRPAIIEGSIIDISERRRLEEQLEQVQKLEALGHLAGGIAHDFNNLLMSISGSAELLKLSYPKAGEELGELKVIRETVKRGAELTRRLLAIARQQVLEMETIDLRALVEGELGLLRRVIPENLELVLLDGAKVPVVRADRGQLSQVMLNMVVNARDAMPQGGSIVIGVEERHLEDETLLGQPGRTGGAYVCVSVEDNGIGMDATTLTHVFEPFFTTKEEGQGTGMGLATVYGIVRQHGGFIDVRSAPGDGTRFEIFLPVATGPARERSDSGEREIEGGDESILVVEDEAAVRSALVGMLQALGYRVIEAENGSEALELLQHGAKVDLVVSDVVMPRVGGRELFERIRVTNPRLAFLFSSGYTDETLRDLLETVDGTSFIAKPFTVSQIARAVRQALSSEKES